MGGVPIRILLREEHLQSLLRSARVVPLLRDCLLAPFRAGVNGTPEELRGVNESEWLIS